MTDDDVDDGEEDGVQRWWASRTPVPGTWTAIDEEAFLDGIEDGLPKGWELHWAEGDAGGRGRVGWFESRDCLSSAVMALDDASVAAVPDLMAAHGFAGGDAGAGMPAAWERPLRSGRVARLVVDRVVEVFVRRGDSEAALVLSLSPHALAAAWPGLGPEGLASLAVAAAVSAFGCTLDRFYMGPSH